MVKIFLAQVVKPIFASQIGTLFEDSLDQTVSWLIKLHCFSGFG